MRVDDNEDDDYCHDDGDNDDCNNNKNDNSDNDDMLLCIPNIIITVLFCTKIKLPVICIDAMDDYDIIPEALFKVPWTLIFYLFYGLVPMAIRLQGWLNVLPSQPLFIHRADCYGR